MSAIERIIAELSEKLDAESTACDETEAALAELFRLLEDES